MAKQRKPNKGYGRPVLPGYFPPSVHHTHTTRPQSKDREKEDTESSLRDSIPAMMKPGVKCLIGIEKSKQIHMFLATLLCSILPCSIRRCLDLK
jgi:hypothetical protein